MAAVQIAGLNHTSQVRVQLWIPQLRSEQAGLPAALLTRSLLMRWEWGTKHHFHVGLPTRGFGQ